MAKQSVQEPQDIAQSSDAPEVGASAALISVCVIISRITGFLRTWTMAFALGATVLASAYQIANNLPSMLYELVAGGMLVTAFLPVYVSVKRKQGDQVGNDYASNLLTIVVVFLGIVALFCVAFPSIVVYTQSFFNDQSEVTQAVFFFQFFAIQVIFYGASAIISGLLNANRDYLWSSIAPAANNIIVIVTFLLYAAVAPQNQTLALYIIAIGNPLGVFMQLVLQYPALKRNGVRLRPRIDFRDPALLETLHIGIPAVLVMLCSFAVVSVQNAAAYCFSDNGPSVLVYARLWYTLPYAFLAVPITTTLFTELADMQAAGQLERTKQTILSGSQKIAFFTVPFALYLFVFAQQLVTLYHAGAFTEEHIEQVANFLKMLAFCLPFYCVNTYLQKTFSALRKMWVFAGYNFLAGGVQIALTWWAAMLYQTGNAPLEAIALAELVFYLVADGCLFAYLHRNLGDLGLRSLAGSFLRAFVYGALGAVLGAGILALFNLAGAPIASSIPWAFGALLVGGGAALVATFGLAIVRHDPEAAYIGTLIQKIAGKLGRAR